jgi:hypothetical protein
MDPVPRPKEDCVNEDISDCFEEVYDGNIALVSRLPKPSLVQKLLHV